MITARPQKNLQTAKAYFRQHLAKDDYHSEGQTVAGWWFGQGAMRLGLDLAAPVTQAAFERLCDNLHPLTGEKLTVRHRQADRRVVYDFTISAPKSVSIMAHTVGDERILTAHAEAAVAAMLRMEQTAATRVRRGGRQEERTTGEIVAAVFRHDTSRALDPQLHTHFVVFNATWDATEQRWKALQTEQMFEQMTFFTEVYRGELARRLQGLGYRLRPAEHGFEIEGVSPTIIERFSKRRRSILEAEAKLSAELGQSLSNNARATLAHSSRQRKDSSLSAAEVQAHQRAQLSAEEFATLRRLLAGSPPTVTPAPAAAPVVSAAEAIDYAREHLFERRSVVARHELLATALSYTRYTTPLEVLESELASRPEFIMVDNLLTTEAALRQEQRMVALVNQGMGKCGALNPTFVGDRELTDEQRLALKLVLRAPDQVIGLRGGAGTGKTRLLREAIRGLEERHPTTVLAPTTAAVEALREEGLPRAATVQRFLADEKFQHDARGSVVVVDEAGLLSGQDLLTLLEWSHAHRSRLLLSGDIRQHASIEAGDALRLLEARSTLRMIGVHGIRRQVDREYREAIADLARGHGLAGLTWLEKLGAVHEVREHERYQFLAADYVASVKAGKSALIVSPTWREIETVTGEVRARLKAGQLLGENETAVPVHHALKWTRAQKRDLRNYRPGLVLTFHRGTKDFAPGEWAEVIRAGSDTLQVRKPHGQPVSVTKKQAGCFDVAKVEELPVATGDRLLIQGNCQAAGLHNGQMVSIEQVRPDGRIRLAGGQCLPPDFRAFTHGYCVTSHAAQGRTVDHVYVAVDSQSIRSASLNQFYVSASRGREKVAVFTDDLMFLRQAVTRPAARLSATELIERVRLANRPTASEKPTLKVRPAP
jgi:conjugative relaxase-like TrwC/TraI family protein